MERISSTQNPTIKLIRSLREKRHRQEAELFLAEGATVLARAREKGWTPKYLVLREEEAPPEFEGMRVLAVSEKVMASLSAQANPPEAIGVFSQRMGETLPEPAPRDVWVVLDNIRDPGNLGTIIRTVDAVGASGVILIGQACDPWSSECVRATMGSIFAVPLVRMHAAAFAKIAESWPGEIVAAQMEAGADYRRTYRGPVMLLMGSEGSGLSPALSGLANVGARIPMPGGAQSLNVATATALMLYEIRRPELT
jgi:RNA methyltransferase, TrmH family